MVFSCYQLAENFTDTHGVWSPPTATYTGVFPMQTSVWRIVEEGNGKCGGSEVLVPYNAVCYWPNCVSCRLGWPVRIVWPTYKVRLLTGLSSYSTYVCTDCAHAMSSVVPLVRNVAIVENVDLCTENVRKVMYTCYKVYNALDSCVRLSTSVECVECLCRCNLIAPNLHQNRTPHLTCLSH